MTARKKVLPTVANLIVPVKPKQKRFAHTAGE
jgi:hypothetical protein